MHYLSFFLFEYDGPRLILAIGVILMVAPLLNTKFT